MLRISVQVSVLGSRLRYIRAPLCHGMEQLAIQTSDQPRQSRTHSRRLTFQVARPSSALHVPVG